jgi:hypothetical protein
MAVKTFTSGEVLTASDTNTYLNNGGLVYIKSTTIGNAVSTVSVTDVFSSTYTNYRIVVEINAQSADGYVRIQFNNQTGSYYYDLASEMTWTTASVTAVASAVGTVGRISRYSSALGRVYIAGDIMGPNATARTFYQGQATAPGYFWTSGAQEASDTSHTGFTLTPSSGTWTGGKIIVYGYRTA